MSQFSNFWARPPKPTPLYPPPVVRRSSAVEQLTVNQLVVGSIPTAGAIQNNTLANFAGCFLFVSQT